MKPLTQKQLGYLSDALSVVGLVVLGVGLWLVSPALALCVVGVLLLAAGLLGARRFR